MDKEMLKVILSKRTEDLTPEEREARTALRKDTIQNGKFKLRNDARRCNIVFHGASRK